MEIKRSINHVSFLLLGLIGAGKSATVNHLLGVYLAKTSETKSETKSTREFVIHSNDPKYKVKGLSLGLVDTPGFCDTDGPRQDVCNFLSIQRFFRTHPTLSGCYPNLFFLVLKATDNRVKGEYSEFGTSLRIIKQLDLVDPNNPNVVAILTHACSIRKKKDEEWTKELDKIKSNVSKIIFDALKVLAPVVLIEYKYEDCGLERRGDYTVLPNGEVQPKNLYLACADVLNNDSLGLVTLNRIFVESEKNDYRITLGHEFEAKNAKECILDSKGKAMVKLFQLSSKGGFRDPFCTVILQYINEQKLNGHEAEEVMKIAGVLTIAGDKLVKEIHQTLDHTLSQLSSIFLVKKSHPLDGKCFRRSLKL